MKGWRSRAFANTAVRGILHPQADGADFGSSKLNKQTSLWENDSYERYLFWILEYDSDGSNELGRQAGSDIVDDSRAASA
jgi:hypothetical protein